MDDFDIEDIEDATDSQKESDSNDVSPIKENSLLKSGNGWSKCGWNLIVRQSDYCALPNRLGGVITIGTIKEASKVIRKTGFVDKTPIFNGRKLLGLNKKASLCIEDFGLKLENTQYSGSFKIRGASYQFSKLQDIKDKELITISAENYGRSFAYLARELGVAKNAAVFMPKTVNETRRSKIKALGVNVNCSYSQDKLVERVKDYQLVNGSVFLHPFDDPDVLIGHASAGLEVLEQMPSVDIVLVCCGGGGFLAGITAAIRLSGNTHTKVYGVKHELDSTFAHQHHLSIGVLFPNHQQTTSTPFSSPTEAPLISFAENKESKNAFTFNEFHIAQRWFQAEKERLRMIHGDEYMSDIDLYNDICTNHY